MTDDFVPEADAIEQRQDVDPDDEQVELDVDTADDVPEADAIEQSQPVDDPPDEQYDAG